MKAKFTWFIISAICMIDKVLVLLQFRSLDHENSVRAEARAQLFQVDALGDDVLLQKVLGPAVVGQNGQLPVVQLHGDVVGGVLLHVQDKFVLISLLQLEQHGAVGLVVEELAGLDVLLHPGVVGGGLDGVRCGDFRKVV